MVSANSMTYEKRAVLQVKTIFFKRE